MRLADLKPEFRQRYARRDPVTKEPLDPLPEVDLTFICPKCGAPANCAIILTTNAFDPNIVGKWHVPALPNGPGWADRLTVTPSVQEPAQAHGPNRPPCNAHFSIINGEIVP